ncbi:MULTISPECIES: copper-binding periplasmic metallochaperone CueP [Citrobacter freundii complex]|uniref:copper-binding periplasmic metallochaperone CueP n=1 Tax=Citrobacter gillenii TaxID=67828 RepID=UPI0015EAC328|nr:copper-binding periplasmic metallochaperone CueP [Citrobacter freundii]QLR71165.1 copper-binding periplasmic metallochaperone CueP [Citrobacter freundii]QLY50374.1 copper-binding periplasmic metallochaperone CueP [Citrobacter freundii]QLY59099.1 copper-binding periplasmic metallochaperone CueP [Citrobacter freundii]QMG39176.1 copper-binding periplasmic metallochaperone CueP [Citrobacter freundii]
MSKTSLLLLLGLLTTSSVFAGTPESTFLAQHGLSGKSVEQIVDAIDQSPQSRPLPYSASITSTELKLSSGEQVYTLPLGDKFYLSFAPYEWQTHPCFNHSLSGCKGEMPEKTFDVKVTDSKGDVVVQKAMTSYRNGFIGVWLPRNMEGTIEVSYNGKKASHAIKTMNDSQTCLTELQLR